MKRQLLFILSSLLLLSSCHDVEKWENNPEGNFDALWTIVDEHYCFFEEKNIDWDSIYQVYRPQVTSETDYIKLFGICSNMLAELKDGHVNLTSWFSTSYYKKWWSDYPQNFDERLIDEYYLNFSEFSRNGLKYYVLRDSVAYIRYPSFATTPGEGTLDWALALLSQCRGLVFDIRDNGGGLISNVEMITRRFINERTLAGYICHKSGPAHNDFSEPYAYYFEPAREGLIKWDKPVVILTNRSTFSSANNFASVMQYLPNVTLIGDRTGGGSGMPFTSEIPCGWFIRFSSSPVYDANMQLTEYGVEPDIYINLDKESALKGIDTMLEKAIDVIVEQTPDYEVEQPGE